MAFCSKKYKRIFKKQESSYNDEKIEQTHSDTESDKTNNERKQHSNHRSSNSNSSRSNDKSISTNYDKRDSSLDIVRNDEDNYEVVLPYQRIVK